MFEVPKNLKYVVAKPRMQKYIDYAADIYGIYLDYMHKSDIYVYSIDESFLDITDYLSIYKKTPKEFVRFLIEEIARRTHIPATAGIGTNLYLAKIALDITAKKSPDRIGYLDEALFQKTLWDHTPSPILGHREGDRGAARPQGRLYDARHRLSPRRDALQGIRRQCGAPYRPCVGEGALHDGGYQEL